MLTESGVEELSLKRGENQWGEVVSHDLNLYIRNGQESCINWEEQPRELIQEIARLYVGGVEEFLLGRINRYVSITKEKRDCFEQITDISQSTISASGSYTPWGCGTEYEDITLPLEALWADLDEMQRIEDKRRAEQAKREQARREQEAKREEQRREAQDRADYERLKQKFGGS